ncbi:MAG: hypothetical protein ACPIOQ_52850, partial [Promethearchaeia archaeon]
VRRLGQLRSTPQDKPSVCSAGPRAGLHAAQRPASTRTYRQRSEEEEVAANHIKVYRGRLRHCRAADAARPCGVSNS